MIDVIGDAGERFVLVNADATAAEDPPAREAFTLSVGEETHAPTTNLGFGGSLDDYYYLPSSVYDAELPSGVLPFALSEYEEPPGVALTWPGLDGEWPLEDASEALARPDATFAVDAFEAKSDGDQVPSLSVTVENTGDVRGWFVGAINRRGPSVAIIPVTGFAFEVDAGETVTETVGDGESFYGSGTAEYTLETAGGRYDASAEVE